MSKKPSPEVEKVEKEIMKAFYSLEKSIGSYAAAGVLACIVIEIMFKKRRLLEECK